MYQEPRNSGSYPSRSAAALTSRIEQLCMEGRCREAYDLHERLKSGKGEPHFFESLQLAWNRFRDRRSPTDRPWYPEKVDSFETALAGVYQSEVLLKQGADRIPVKTWECIATLCMAHSEHPRLVKHLPLINRLLGQMGINVSIYAPPDHTIGLIVRECLAHRELANMLPTLETLIVNALGQTNRRSYFGPTLSGVGETQWRSWGAGALFSIRSHREFPEIDLGPIAESLGNSSMHHQFAHYLQLDAPWNIFRYGTTEQKEKIGALLIQSVVDCQTYESLPAMKGIVLGMGPMRATDFEAAFGNVMLHADSGLLLAWIFGLDGAALPRGWVPSLSAPIESAKLGISQDFLENFLASSLYSKEQKALSLFKLMYSLKVGKVYSAPQGPRHRDRLPEMIASLAARAGVSQQIIRNAGMEALLAVPEMGKDKELKDLAKRLISLCEEEKTDSLEPPSNEGNGLGT